MACGHRPHRELGRDYLDHACIQPLCLHLSLAKTHPFQGACVSLGGPGPMHSFSDVREKLLQIRYITQSVVATDKHPWFPHGMLPTYLHLLSPPTGKANSITPTEGTTKQLLSDWDYTGQDMDGVQHYCISSSFEICITFQATKKAD